MLESFVNQIKGETFKKYARALKFYFDVITILIRIQNLESSYGKQQVDRNQGREVHLFSYD